MSMQTANMRIRTIYLTGFTLVAFASNSVLCRLALGEVTIDAASFSTIRLVSGAATLLVIATFLTRNKVSVHRSNWTSAAMLFLYAVAFSFAYVSLSAGTGALILFGAVQATMIIAGVWSGERPRLLQWVGLVVAVVGLVYLVFPGLTAPSLTGSMLMTAAGIAWGVYSLKGRGTVDPIGATTDNFVRSVPLVLVVNLIMLPNIHLSAKGIWLAALSGSIASGIGYIIWYAALQGLTTTRAATVQLSVPVLAAIGGVIFLSEGISIRLVLSAITILGGVAMTVLSRERSARVSRLTITDPPPSNEST